jgi:3-deoxy-D-manno-octulosonate 8-phosphate phosphatase (KDO 8-P phosphatase)
MPLLAAAARRVQLIVFDADGVLTDGGLYVGNEAREHAFQRFDVRDGVAVAMLRRAGIRLAIVSSRESEAVRRRAVELGIEDVYQVSPFAKVATVEIMLTRDGLDWSQVAFLADDLPDVALLERVGVPAAVGDAVPEVRCRAMWCGSARGGHGAVREFTEALLRARGEWDGLVNDYLKESREGG